MLTYFLTLFLAKIGVNCTLSPKRIFHENLRNFRLPIVSYHAVKFFKKRLTGSWDKSLHNVWFKSAQNVPNVSNGGLCNFCLAINPWKFQGLKVSEILLEEHIGSREVFCRNFEHDWVKIATLLRRKHFFKLT